MGGPRENPERRGFVRGAGEDIEAERFVLSGQGERGRITDRARRARSVHNVRFATRAEFTHAPVVASVEARFVVTNRDGNGFVGFFYDVAMKGVRERVRTESYGDEGIAGVCRRSEECAETNSDGRDELGIEQVASKVFKVRVGKSACPGGRVQLGTRNRLGSTRLARSCGELGLGWRGE